MTLYEDSVREFTQAMGQPLGVPLTQDPALVKLRMELLLEEHDEFICALLDYLRVPSPETYQNLLKEFTDIQYVLTGFGLTFGFPAEEVFRRVHESNLSKLGPDGRPVYREDGKVLKGPNYHPPRLEDLTHASH